MKNINKVLEVLIFSDMALLAGMGFLTPIFAIFLTQNIQGATIQTAGLASGIYWVVNSLAMIPIGKFLDRQEGEKDDLLAVILGNFLTALVAFGYIFSRETWHIYFLQAVYGLGMALNIPAYTAIFSRHLNKGKEAFAWGFRGAATGIVIGVAEGAGGFIAQRFGFNVLFSAAGIIVLASAFLLFFIIKEMKKKDGAVVFVPAEIVPKQVEFPKNND